MTLPMMSLVGPEPRQQRRSEIGQCVFVSHFLISLSKFSVRCHQGCYLHLDCLTTSHESKKILMVAFK